MGLSIGMGCSCEGHFSVEIDGEDTSGAWLLVYRFADAHVKCGYMTAPSRGEKDAAAPKA